MTTLVALIGSESRLTYIHLYNIYAVPHSPLFLRYSRFDMVNKLHQDSGMWDKALEVRNRQTDSIIFILRSAKIRTEYI